MFRPTSTCTAAAVIGLSLTMSAPALAAPASDAVASATYGQAEVALQKDPRHSGRVQLTYRPGAGQAASVVDAQLPGGIKARSAAVGLGLDATGLLTAVVQTPKGIHWVRVTRPDGVHRIARTAGAESPAIFHGHVAYVCQDGAAVCKASLRTKARKVLHREPSGSQWRISDVRIGKGDALAILAERDGALGASRIQVKRAAGKPKTIAEANLDGGEAVLLRDVSPASDHLNVLRRDYAPGGEPSADPVDTLAVFTFPGGKPVS